MGHLPLPELNPTMDLKKFQILFAAKRKAQLDREREHINSRGHAWHTLDVIAHVRRGHRLVGMTINFDSKEKP